VPARRLEEGGGLHDSGEVVAGGDRQRREELVCRGDQGPWCRPGSELRAEKECSPADRQGPLDDIVMRGHELAGVGPVRRCLAWPDLEGKRDRREEVGVVGLALVQCDEHAVRGERIERAEALRVERDAGHLKDSAG
jgi:hypothetical protein